MQTYFLDGLLLMTGVTKTASMNSSCDSNCMEDDYNEEGSKSSTTMNQVINSRKFNDSNEEEDEDAGVLISEKF